MRKAHKTQLERQVKAEIKSDLEAFLEGAAEIWRTPQGALTTSERRERLAIAERYASWTVRDFLTDRDLQLPDLVDSESDLSRPDFLRMIMDDFESLEARHARS